jgi:hypothetical protein
MWFDAELKEARRRATVADMAEILNQLTAAASPESRAGVSIREIIMRLEWHTVTNDELGALKKLKDAGPDPDVPLISYVRAVFARRFIGVDGWPAK